MAPGKLTVCCCLIVMLLLATDGDAASVGKVRLRRSVDSTQLNPELTGFNDDCPNGYIAYRKFNTTTGVFDCAIKTAEICFALCDTFFSSNWDITNPISIMDPTEKSGWYCRALPGYATRPCYFKPKDDILRDVQNMFAQDHVMA